MKGVGGGRGLFDQPLGHVFVGDLDLLVAGAGVGELFPAVGVVQVLPHHRHLFGDVEASVLLGHHLGKNYPTSASFKRSAKKTNKTGSQCSVRLQLGGFRGDTAAGGETWCCKPTLTICSLGSRLQSASVISSPSKKFRRETLMSSMLLWSISSGRGERR